PGDAAGGWFAGPARSAAGPQDPRSAPHHRDPQGHQAARPPRARGEGGGHLGRLGARQPVHSPVDTGSVKPAAAATSSATSSAVSANPVSGVSTAAPKITPTT